MTDFGEALVEAVVTLSGMTYLVDGVHEVRVVAAGAVCQMAEALAAAAHMHPGAMTEAVGADRGAAFLAAEAAEVFLEEAQVEEAEVALEAPL